MAYATYTLDQAVADLARRQNQTPGYTNFWTEEENALYIIEALQTFSAHTNFFRETFQFDLVPDQVWYDLSDLALIPTTLRGQSVTDVDLYTLIQYHFLEPPTGAAWTGSRQFTIEDLIAAVQHERDQLLYDAGYHISRTVQPQADYINTLDERSIDIRRIAWLPNTAQQVYFASPMWRDDQWEINSFFRNRTPSTGIPETYRLSTQPPLTFATNVIPFIAGDYEILTVNSGPVLTAAVPTVLTIPNDFAWLIKFGAMGDLLGRESVARDPLRAQYCEMRYKQGVALLRSASAVLNAEMSYTTIDIDAVQNADNFNVGWQGRAGGVPINIYTAGLNLIGFSPAPDSNYEVDLTVVRNAPLPASGSDFLQIGREDYDAILDYAQHLAAFKQGGMEFAMTIPLLNNFIRHCKLYNSKLLQMGEFTDIIFDQSRTQDMFFPITQPLAEEVE